MTTAQLLTEDLDRARQRVRDQEQKDPDNLVALSMFRADVRRAREALGAWAADHPEQAKKTSDAAALSAAQP